MKLTTTVIWGCTGMDTTQLSYRLAKSEAEKGKTLLVELPCLGIPRLGFTANIMDRVCNIEALIMKIEQDQPIQWQWVHQVHSQLGVLPASVFATPDSPIVTKVNMRTLISVASSLIDFASREQCRHLVMDCQGQLTNPMTFFALKYAERVIIPVSKPTDVAFVLANVRRLAQIFKHPVSKYILLVEGDVRAIKRFVVIKGENGKPLEGLKVIAWDKDALAKIFDPLHKLYLSNQDIESSNPTETSKVSEVLHKSWQIVEKNKGTAGKKTNAFSDNLPVYEASMSNFQL